MHGLLVSWPHILDVWAKHAVNRKVADGRCLFMAGSSKESDTGRARVKIPSRTHTHTHIDYFFLLKPPATVLRPPKQLLLRPSL